MTGDTSYRLGFVCDDGSVASLPFGSKEEVIAEAWAAVNLLRYRHVWIRSWPSGRQIWDHDSVFGHWEAEDFHE